MLLAFISYIGRYKVTKAELARLIRDLADKLSCAPITGVSVTVTGGPGGGPTTGLRIEVSSDPSGRPVTGMKISVGPKEEAERNQLVEELREAADELERGTKPSLIRSIVNKAGDVAAQVGLGALFQEVIAGLSAA